MLALVAALLATLGAAMFACFMPGLRNETAAPKTMDSVNIERYQGVWHEIARLPNWFQRKCRQSTATYRIIEPGKISVENECIAADGSRQAIRGTATVVDPQTNAKLEVVFDTWFFRLLGGLIKGKYWIFFVDDDYQTAVVGTPDRHYLWVLARTPALPEARYQELVSLAGKLGFKTEDLIRNAPPQ
jgi:apolipoprotein D and lipocalin family protein